MLILERRRGKIIDVFDESYEPIHSFHVSTPEESDHLVLVCKLNSKDSFITEVRIPIIDGQWKGMDADIPGQEYSIRYQIKVEVRSDKHVCLLFELPPCIKILRREVVERDGIEKYQNASRHLELI